MPRTREAVQESNRKFYEMHQFPNVIGLIDGCHIRIANPGGENAGRFINRKGFYSLNTQVIGNADDMIINIVARWAGSVHDSRIFDESRVKAEFERGQINGLLLGDPGYPFLPYLMTPVRNPVTQAERNYNRAQRRTRSRVERMFGFWKRRFACLHYTLRIELQTSFAVIVASAVLHNIAVALRDPQFHEEEQIIVIADQDINNEVNRQGRRVRDALIRDHFQ